MPPKARFLTDTPTARRAGATLAAGALLTSSALVATGCAASDDETTAAPSTAVQVVKVVDGDTINVRLNGTHERVRMATIDAPERTTTRFGVFGCGGQAATDALRALLAGRTVTLRRASTEDRDRYGRLVREVLADGRSADEQMVRDGWAQQFRVPSGGGGAAANRRIARAAADARTHDRGVWKLCGGFSHP